MSIDRDESLPPTQILSSNEQTPPTDDDSVDKPLQRQNAFPFMGRAPTAPAAPAGRKDNLAARNALNKSR